MKLLSLILLLPTATSFHVSPPLSPSSPYSTSSLWGLKSNTPFPQGSTVALITPMLDSGEIDFASYKATLTNHLESNTAGLCVLGTTAEAATMSLTNRAKILQATVDTVAGKIPFMVGCGTINMDDVVVYMEQAREFGADAALVVTPYYVKPTQKGMVEFYEGLSSRVPDVPIVLYNVPGRTGCDMTAATAGEIVKRVGIDKVIGMKEASGDVSRVADYRKEPSLGEDFMLWSGDDDTGADFVLKGGDGIISVSANLVPQVMQNIMTAALSGDAATVATLNGPLKTLHNDIFCQPNPIPTKWALQKMGLIESCECRTPLHKLEEEFEGKVENAMKIAGLL